LNDHLCPRAHGHQRGGDSPFARFDIAQVNGALASGAKPRHIVALVFEAASEERFEEWIRPRGPLALSKRFAHLQCRSVPAVQEIGEI
jgi:hypothetical protein